MIKVLTLAKAPSLERACESESESESYFIGNIQQQEQEQEQQPLPPKTYLFNGIELLISNIQACIFGCVTK
jgi:hypothetical protein